MNVRRAVVRNDSGSRNFLGRHPSQDGDQGWRELRLTERPAAQNGAVIMSECIVAFDTNSQLYFFAGRDLHAASLGLAFG